MCMHSIYRMHFLNLEGGVGWGCYIYMGYELYGHTLFHGCEGGHVRGDILL
jgi:hypothetical protein